MQEARDACLHLKLDQAGRETLSHCICTGIVVTYARSFGANQGLSGMGSEFRKFPDPGMQSLHDFLLEARDAIYAHKDSKKEAARLSTAKELEEVGRIEIHISETGTTEWEVKRSPPGYIGHDVEGQLTGKLRSKPYSVVLLDEIEKAHVRVFDLFLQVFDEGRLTDAKGRTADARNAIFVLTSNILSESRKAVGFGREQAINPQSAALGALKSSFRPEFMILRTS